jgi:hypothetical protein
MKPTPLRTSTKRRLTNICCGGQHGYHKIFCPSRTYLKTCLCGKMFSGRKTKLYCSKRCKWMRAAAKQNKRQWVIMKHKEWNHIAYLRRVAAPFVL